MISKAYVFAGEEEILGNRAIVRSERAQRGAKRCVASRGRRTGSYATGKASPIIFLVEIMSIHVA